MCPEELIKIPCEPLVCGMIFDQIINSHIAISGLLCHLIAMTHSHLALIIPTLPFPLWLGLIILFNNAFCFCPIQEHVVTPIRIMTMHPSRHLCCVVLFVTCSEGHLCEIDMKTFWRLCVVAIKGAMRADCRDIVDEEMKFWYVETFAYAKIHKYGLVFMYR